MGAISAIMNDTLAIPGMTALMPTLWFGRAPDRETQPPVGVLYDEGRDPVINDANFEAAQVLFFNLRFEFWTATLADCESWATLMDSVFLFGSVAVTGFGQMQESVEVGKVVFEQERDRSLFAGLVHKCTYPVRFPIVKES